MSYKTKLIMPILYTILGMGFCMYVVVYSVPNFWQYTGMTVTAISFVFWIAARVQLADNFSIGAQANELVTTGIYGKLSHPVYYFSITALGGIVLVAQNWFVAVAWGALVVLEIVRIRSEERVLRQKFGSKYQKYKQQVWL